MPTLPTVAIIGRPNTGKSTLFNRLVGKRKAIVSEVPGTTRDHIAHRIETSSLDFLLLDTGGMGGGTDDPAFEKDVHRQSLLALENADLLLFTVDSREELTKSDYAIVDLLRKNKRDHVPVILVATKCDHAAQAEALLPPYHALGIAEDVLAVSAFHNFGTEELVHCVIRHLKKLHFKREEEKRTKNTIPRIAVIGKPNVGKSSLINAFMSEPERKRSPLLVSDIPGTTRDAVDTLIRYHDEKFIFIDTAGLKRRVQGLKEVETYAMFRSISALEECDIALLVLDAKEPLSHQDKHIAGLAIEEGKGLILLLHKIDLLKAEKRKEKMKELALLLPFCRFAPILPCSAKTRDGLLKIFDLLAVVQRNRTRHIPTHELNRWYRDTVEGHAAKGLQKSKHITQANEVPPTFVLFVRDPKQVQLSELKFLENRLRSTFDFAGTPIKWITKAG
ncbi:MAG: ribosome biogenesis GTPase Der [Candidatus Peribacteraceae bacterium]|nr:ribosome biogenesis GTPase Der [Candidatus Peribacteraceae bacterium]